MNRNLIRTSLLMIFMSIPVGYSNVVFAEAPVYSLDPVYVVGAHKVLDSDKFGNIITEQSYYRTGGDVEVVNRKEIEDHHYNSISEAIKSIPGVTFSNPGYRANWYGYAAYCNAFSINGDTRVVVLVDGRRVDNPATELFGDSSVSARLKKNIRNQYALFERNENYWGEKPKFKYVKVSIIPEVSTIENALRSGDADMYVDQDGALSFEEAFNLQQEGFSVGITPLSQIVLIALNTEKIREIPIRKALALGTDKRGVIQFLAEGNLKEAHYYWTENLPEMPPGLPYYSFDRKQADEILDKQYHRGTGPYREKDGVRLQLSLGYPAGNHNQRNLALILKDMYAKIGIDLIPDEDDFSVYLNKFRDGKYDMVLYTTWGNAYEPYSTLTEMRTDGSGFNMFQRGADDKETLFKAMKEMDSSPERESVLRYMEYINGSFYRNVLFIPLYHDYIIHVCRNDISGFVPQEDAKDRIDITHVFRQY